MKNWIRRSFKNRIFVTVLLITLVPLLLSNVLMMQIQVQRSTENQQAEAEALLCSVQTRMTELCRSFSRVSENLCGGVVVRSVIRQDTTDSRILYQVLFRDTQSLRQYARFDIRGRSGQCFYSTANPLPTRELDPDWGILRAAGTSRKLVYQAGTGEDAALEAAQAVRSYDGTILGYLVITMTRQDLDLLFGSDCGQPANLILLDSYWETVYCSQAILADDTVSALRQQLLQNGTLEDPDGQFRYFLTREPETGFYLILQQPRAFTAQALATFHSISVITGLLCLVLCLLCVLWLSRYLSEPVHRLDAAMGAVHQGDFSVHLETDREDELGRLSNSFNRMVEEYQANLNRSVQRQRELNSTQIRMMQAQLNPHFLYNTLDSIKWLGVTHQVPQIAAMATDLAAILRASISDEEFVTLEQELEIIDRYLEIQYIRFEDRFSCEIDIAEQFQHCLIPRLALQPLVENAIIHGVADMDDGYIKITAREEDGDLILCVSDNGCGIPPETLALLNSPGRHLPGRHLGLYNVDQIARLHFGDGYGIQVASLPGQGSQVSLRIPILRKES